MIALQEYHAHQSASTQDMEQNDIGTITTSVFHGPKLLDSSGEGSLSSSSKKIAPLLLKILIPLPIPLSTCELVYAFSTATVLTKSLHIPLDETRIKGIALCSTSTDISIKPTNKLNDYWNNVDLSSLPMNL